MQRFRSATPAILVILSVLVVPFARTAPAEAAACTFVLGFQTVHDAIPDAVGDCKVDVHYNPANGDGLQETNNGLMVWRKADNFTAFTDGYRSWVNGPYGIMQRLNTERFDWEPVDPQAIALNLNDMPAGTMSEPKFSRYTYNEQLIKESKDPAKTSSRLKESGRLQGYEGFFINTTRSGLEGTLMIMDGVEIFQNPDGARVGYQESVSSFTDSTEVSAPQVGEESQALNAKLTVGSGKDKSTVNAYVIVFRKGTIAAWVATFGMMGKLNIDDTIKYAQLVESRIK